VSSTHISDDGRKNIAGNLNLLSSKCNPYILAKNRLFNLHVTSFDPTFVICSFGLDSSVHETKGKQKCRCEERKVMEEVRYISIINWRLRRKSIT
jgi:hypothetical protein